MASSILTKYTIYAAGSLCQSLRLPLSRARHASRVVGKASAQQVNAIQCMTWPIKIVNTLSADRALRSALLNVTAKCILLRWLSTGMTDSLTEWLLTQMFDMTDGSSTLQCFII